MHPLKIYHGPSHSLFHRNSNSGCSIVLETIPESSSSHGLWPLRHWCKFGSQWLQCRAVGQSWPSSYAYQRSCGLLQEHNPMPLECCHGHVPTQTGGFCQSFSVEPWSRDCLCWAYRKLISFSSISSAQFIWSLHLCPSTWHSFWRLYPYQSQPHPPFTSLSQMKPDLYYSSSFLLQYHHQDQWWL